MSQSNKQAQKRTHEQVAQGSKNNNKNNNNNNNKPQQKQNFKQAPAAVTVKSAPPKPSQPTKSAAPPAKKQKKEEEEDEDESDVDPNVAEKEEALNRLSEVVPEFDELEDQMNVLEEELNNKVLAIQKEYVEKKRPLYRKRDALISKLSQFWSTIFHNCDDIEALLQLEDDELMNALTCVEVTDNFVVQDDDVSVEGFTITFTFGENGHLKAGKVSKVFIYEDEGESINAQTIKNVPWTNNAFAKQNKNSFFVRWFNLAGPDNDEYLSIAHKIRADFYPNALNSYIKALSGEDSDDDDDAMMFEDEDDDEDDEQDEDDEEAPQLVDDENDDDDEGEE